MTATTGWLRRGPALLGGLVAALAFALGTPAAPASAADRPSIRVNQDEFRPKEAVWVYGKVPGAGKGTKVRVYARDHKTKERNYQFTVRTSKSGRFSASLVPKNDTSFYVRVKGYDVSRKVTVEREVGKRTRTQRARLAYKLGSTQGGTKKLSAKQLRALKGRGADRVRLRNYKRGLLVEVTRGTTVRTWRVDGKIRKAYLKAGGPTGKYGLPRGDAECHLLEDGCVQRFENGSLYSNKNRTKASGQVGRSEATELVAAARSQLSYRSTRLRSKFNKWSGSVGQPWCSAFVAWAAAASGNSHAVPKHARLHQLIPIAKKTMRTYTNRSKREPRLGTLAFFNWGGGTASHIGIVLKASRTKLVTLEGNASRGSKFTAKRGVFIHERARSSVDFYADPRW